MPFYRAFMHGDAVHSIGHGWRTIHAVEGRKWAYLMDVFSLMTNRLPLKHWHALKPELRSAPKKIKKYVDARLATTGQMTARIKEMLKEAKEEK